MSVSNSQSLDSADYNPIAHLNAIFPTPDSLTSLPDVSSRLTIYQNGLDTVITDQISARVASDQDNINRVQEARTELTDLFKYIDSVRSQATETEDAISSMMFDIKRLDTTKNNLTQSMTVLKRLQMLTTAYEQLRSLSKMRHYGDCHQLVQAVTMLTSHFKPFRSIDQVAALSRNVSELQRELLENVCDDFEVAFSKGEVTLRRNQLADGCLVVDALGEQGKVRLINWYCNTQLREYRQIFRIDQESGSLDNISRRYSWFSRLLRTYDAEHAPIFPADWRVDEKLANTFCENTGNDYRSILKQNLSRPEGQDADVGLLLSCLQETLDFEQGLSRRFMISSGARTSIDTVASAEDHGRPALKNISSAFEPYMGLWIEAQDRQLATLVAGYRQRPIVGPDEDFSARSVITSSTELFHFYRLALRQCSRLAPGTRLLDLCRTFSKYLDLYRQQVLSHFLNERYGSQGPPMGELMMILNTADYCHHTTNQLESTIKMKLGPDQARTIDLQSQADAFFGVAQSVIVVLVRRTDQSCELAWREMRQTNWGKVDTVGDQSSFVGELTSKIQASATGILPQFPKTQYGRLFCTRLANQVVGTFAINIGASRPISETGAEQLLLDLYGMRKCLTEMPRMIPSLSPSAAEDISRIIGSTLDRLDGVLKALQVRSSPPEGLIQAYFIHIRDRSEGNFRKIMELKGITRRSDQSILINMFVSQAASSAHADLPTDPQSFLAAFPMDGQAGVGAGPSVTTKQLGPPGGGGGPDRDRDPFGAMTSPLTSFLQSSPTINPALSAVLTAARESVDRFSTQPGMMSLRPDGPGAGIGIESSSSTAAGGSDGGIAKVNGNGAGGGQAAGLSQNQNQNRLSTGAGLDLKAFGDRFKSTFRIGKGD